MVRKIVVFLCICLLIIGSMAFYNIYMYKKLYCEVNTASILNKGFIHLDKLNSEDVWDSIIVIKPYSQMDISAINMPLLVRRGIDFNRSIDAQCTLLFISNKELKAYSYVPRVPIDFSRIKGERFSREDVILYQPESIRLRNKQYICKHIATGVGKGGWWQVGLLSVNRDK